MEGEVIRLDGVCSRSNEGSRKESPSKGGRSPVLENLDKEKPMANLLIFGKHKEKRKKKTKHLIPWGPDETPPGKPFLGKEEKLPTL